MHIEYVRTGAGTACPRPERVAPVGGGMDGPLAGTLTMEPSIMRRRACWTPSPPTSRVDSGPVDLRAILSTSSMYMMPMLYRVSTQSPQGRQHCCSLCLVWIIVRCLQLNIMYEQGSRVGCSFANQTLDTHVDVVSYI